MFFSAGYITPKGTAAPVQLPAIVLDNESTTAPVYSGIRFDSDGYIYRMDADGNWQQNVAWLLSGAAADYYLHRTIDIGIFTNDDGTALQLNTDNLDYWLSNSVNWFDRTGQITFTIADDASQTTVYATRTYSFSAYKIGTGDPP